MEINKNQSFGNLKISESVIETIAKLATLEVEGVAGMSESTSGLKGLLAKTYQQKPITIELDNDIATITVSVKLYVNENVQKVSEKIQENVKASVQNMCSITVSKVNVYIADVEFENKIDENQE